METVLEDTGESYEETIANLAVAQMGRSRRVDANGIPVPSRAKAGPVTEPGKWRNWANCLDYDPRLFDPDPKGNQVDKDVMETAARLVCSSCIVRELCLAEALGFGIN